MEDILILGHKNPDNDSICAVYAYAHFKNISDRKNRYIPGRCGSLNSQSKFIFDKLEINAPSLYKDIHLKVADVMTENVFYKYEDEPVYEAIITLERQNIRLLPVTGRDTTLKGMISTFELASFFILEDLDSKPKFTINLDCLEKILKGTFIKRRSEKELECVITVGAMPILDFIKYINNKNATNTLLVVGNRKEIIDYAISKQFPCIIVTGTENNSSIEADLNNYEGNIFLTPLETYDAVRLITYSASCRSIMNRNNPVIHAENYLNQVKHLLMSGENRGLPVVDNNNKLIGILTRSNLIDLKPKKVILIDHNEFAQAIDGIETADIIEIIDHHRIGDIKTKYPIHILAKPVGSSCTIIYGLYKSYSIPLEKKVAILLLSGILTDTVILRSPTATEEDIKAVEELSILTDTDYKKWAEEIFSQTITIKKENLKELLQADFKIYDEKSISFGIGQTEVVNFTEITPLKADIVKSLYEIKEEKDLDWVILMVSNIVSNNSILYMTDFQEGEQLLAYKKRANNEYYLENTLSREKQLLPEILNILEQIFVHSNEI